VPEIPVNKFRDWPLLSRVSQRQLQGPRNGRAQQSWRQFGGPLSAFPIGRLS